MVYLKKQNHLPSPRVTTIKCVKAHMTFFEHCNEFVCERTYKAHKDEFYDAKKKKWKQKCIDKRVNVHCQDEDLIDDNIISGKLPNST